jgi:hypothetical protein
MKNLQVRPWDAEAFRALMKNKLISGEVTRSPSHIVRRLPLASCVDRPWIGSIAPISQNFRAEAGIGIILFPKEEPV